MVDTMRQKTHEKVDRLMDRADSLKRSGENKLSQAAIRSKKMKMKIDGYIQENPERSVWLAAGVGFVVGGMIAVSLMRRSHMAHMAHSPAERSAEA